MTKLMRWHFLERLAKENSWTHGAEIGLWKGRTIGHLLDTCPKLHMIGVDPYIPQPDNKGPENWEEWPHVKNRAEMLGRVRPHRDRVKLLFEFSEPASQKVADGSLDFVFIDGDHSEESVRKDIALWSPKLRESGWIIGHDIDWVTVRAAVDDLLPGYRCGPNVCWYRPLHPVVGWDRMEALKDG